MHHTLSAPWHSIVRRAKLRHMNDRGEIGMRGSIAGPARKKKSRLHRRKVRDRIVRAVLAGSRGRQYAQCRPCRKHVVL